jgi:LPPG:FO 2-phospho-L-lactate transferase
LISVIAGGTGSIKLIRGLSRFASDMAVISNVADNIWLHGLYVCPDLDTAMYGLAGMLDTRRGWGVENDSFEFLNQMKKLGQSTWFRIGDKDLATHLLRTNMLHNGKNLSEITDYFRKRYRISAKVMPVTNSHMETTIQTEIGEMHIQEFWVKERGQPRVSTVKYHGSRQARVNAEAINVLRKSRTIIIAPANPITSIGPMLTVRSFKRELINQKKKIIAISPVLGNEAISGPAIKYMQAMNLELSPVGVAKHYSEFISSLVISETDRRLSDRITRMGIKVYETDIIMKNRADETRLAKFLLEKCLCS